MRSLPRAPPLIALSRVRKSRRPDGVPSPSHARQLRSRLGRTFVLKETCVDAGAVDCALRSATIEVARRTPAASAGTRACIAAASVKERVILAVRPIRCSVLLPVLVLRQAQDEREWEEAR